MLPTKASTCFSSRRAVQLARASSLPNLLSSKPSYILLQPACSRVSLHLSESLSASPFSPRAFSSSPASRLRDFFPAKETEQIRQTAPAWPHPGYTEEDMLSVVPGHRKPENWGDWVAWKLVRVARYCMDRATGMSSEQQVDKRNPTTAVVAKKPLTEAQWVCLPLEIIIPYVAY